MAPTQALETMKRASGPLATSARANFRPAATTHSPALERLTKRSMSAQFRFLRKTAHT